MQAGLMFSLTCVLVSSSLASAALVPDCVWEETRCGAAIPAARQFDFWLGEWELTWPGEHTGLPAGQTGRGTNRIRAILDSCVIEESFSAESPVSLRGLSFSVYNRHTGEWQQTWVDNEGSYLDFTGGFRDGKMILVRQATTPEGSEFLQRMVWHNLTPTELDWNWEASHDEGKTWQLKWQIHYRRKN